DPLSLLIDQVENTPDPNERAAGYFTLVTQYESSGMETEAQLYLTKISLLDPSNIFNDPTSFFLGKTLTDPKERALHEMALVARGKSWLLGEDKDLDKAKADFQEAVEFNPKNEFAKVQLERIESIQHARRVGYPREFLRGILTTQRDNIRGV